MFVPWVDRLQGLKGFNLDAEDAVIDMDVVHEDNSVLIVTYQRLR